MRKVAWGWVGLIAVVTISAAVLAGLVAPASDIQAQTSSITLVERWNLVAAPGDGTPEEVVGALAEVRSMHRWNPETEQFESWLRTAPTFVNTLALLTAGDGLWMEVTGPVTWPLPPVVPVVAPAGATGLRLIGWTEVTVAADASATQLGAAQVTGWDAPTQSFELFDVALPKPLNSLQTVERGKAYWVAFGAGGPTSFEPVELEVFATQSSPLDFGPLPGSEVFIASKNGLVQRYDLQGNMTGTLLDLRGQVTITFEDGLLSVTVDPNFATNGFVYAYYSVEGETRLSRFTSTGTELIILRITQPNENHRGGTLRFGPDGMLYLSVGDGGPQEDPEGHAQDLTLLKGKILRIDVSNASAAQPYQVPPDNPFLTTPGARAEIWAYGFRNPWRMAFDPANGDLWVGDVGQVSLEEIDVVQRGGNHGWNLIEGTRCFSVNPCSGLGTTTPVLVYGREEGQSVTGGLVYRGALHAGLQGAYIYGDWGSGTIWAMSAANPGTPSAIASVDQVVSIGTDNLGGLYLVSVQGTIFRVVP